ncbi:MAG: YlzJ-like family protein [Clostridia bacterium]|nr:YlzJ-like family protein [Clostridia bacterium]
MNGLLLYTVLPEERVLQREAPDAPRVELDLGTRRLVVEVVGWGRGRIVCLLSSNPRDYLNPGWQPGRLVRLPAGFPAAPPRGAGGEPAVHPSGEWGCPPFGLTLGEG